MASLRTSDGHEAGLFDGKNVIGSAPDAEVQIRPDLGIAPRHLLLEQNGGEWWITPLNDDSVSTVNGSPLHERRQLKDGAYLKTGDLEFRFVQDSPPLPPKIKPAEKAPVLPEQPTFSPLPPLPVGPAKAIPVTHSNERRPESYGKSRKILIAATIFVLLVAAIIGTVIVSVAKANAGESPFSNSFR